MLDETRVEPFRNLFFRPRSANNSGVSKRQITDLVDQSMQINAHCFVVTADNRYILICGFWDKSFRVYSTETGEAPRAPPRCPLSLPKLHTNSRGGGRSHLGCGGPSFTLTW